MATQPVTRIYAWYEVTLKGKRKPTREYKLLATLDGHKTITPDFWQFHGNFWDLSLVFRFETNNETLVNELKSLIEANMATQAYQDAVEAIKEREFKYKRYLETGLRA